MQPLRLASLRLLSYLPQFVASSCDYYKEEGLTIRFQAHSGTWRDLLMAVRKGDLDVVLGNLWFGLNATPPGTLVALAHCCQQCRFVVCARPSSTEPFAWNDLRGRVVLIQSDAPTPWIALREALQLAGVPFNELRALVGYVGQDATNEFLGGAGDFLLVDIDRALKAGLKLVASLASVIGPVPWSVFICSGQTLTARRREILAIRRAIGRALQFIAQNQATALAASIAPFFPDLHRRERTEIIQAYLTLNLWPARPDIAYSDVQHWQSILTRWGLLTAPQQLEAVLPFDYPERFSSR